MTSLKININQSQSFSIFRDPSNVVHFNKCIHYSLYGSNINNINKINKSCFHSTSLVRFSDGPEEIKMASLQEEALANINSETMNNPEVNAQLLQHMKNGILELKELYHPVPVDAPSVSDFLIKTKNMDSASFTEAFPNYLNTPMSEAVNKIDLSPANTPSFLPELPNLVSNNFKSFSSLDLALNYINNKFLIDGSFAELHHKIIHGSLNISNKMIESSDFIIKHIGDGLVLGNTQKVKNLMQEILNFCIENSDKFEFCYKYVLLAVGALYIYKKVVSHYGNLVDKSIPLYSNNPALREKLLITNNLSTKSFAVGKGILITTSLVILVHYLKSIFLSNFIYESNKNKDSLKLNGLWTLIGLPKLPKWLKSLILIVLYLFVFFWLLPYTYSILNLYKINIVLWVIVIAVFSVSLIILFHLINIYILINFASIPNEKIKIPQYLPKFIKNYLLELKEISKYSMLNLFLRPHILTALHLFVLLILFLFFVTYIKNL